MIGDVEREKIIEFITLTGMSNFPDNNTPMEEFLSATYRFYDIIQAYGGCEKKAADAYNEAKENALTIIKERLRYQAPHITTKEKLDFAKEVFADIMNKDFYQTYLQYKWGQVRAYSKQTTVLSRDLYQDYRASLDVPSYVDYSHLPSF